MGDPLKTSISRIALAQLIVVATPWSSAYATYYETLPQGVRMFVAKKVSTSKINSEFDGQKKLNPLALEENINSEMLKSVSEETQLFFNELEKVSPDAYKNFSMGEYQADGFAEVDVQGYGLAYGLTNRLTVYGSIPYYSASVKVNIKRKHNGNLKNVNKLIQSSNNQGGTRVTSPSSLSNFPMQMKTSYNLLL